MRPGSSGLVVGRSVQSWSAPQGVPGFRAESCDDGGRGFDGDDVADAQAADAAMQEYIRNATGTSASPAEELARLGELKEKGLIDDAEFAAAKAKLLG